MTKLLTFLSCLAAATSGLPELEVLRKKLGDAESQLKARSDECDRLREVEGELGEAIKQMTTSAATLKQEHEAELLQMVKAQEVLQKERDDAVAGLEAAKTSHQKELLAAQGQAGNAMEALLEIDDMLSGKFPAAVADMVAFLPPSGLTLLVPITGCWRSTQTAAIAAVETSRQVRRAEGEEIAENAEWGPVDYVEATKARLPLLKGALFVFKTGISKLNRLLWNRQDEPEVRESSEAVAAMLRAAPRRVEHLLDSAVRAGAQTALMLVRSWYPGLDLSVLTGMRAGSDEDVSSVWPDICHRAAMIKTNINPLEYAPYLDSDGNPLEMATFSDLIYSTTSSSDAGAGAEDTGAKPGGSHRTTSSSGEYAMSDPNTEGSASSGQPEGQAAAQRDEDASTSKPGPAEETATPQAEPSTSAATPATSSKATTSASGGGAVPPA